MSLTQGQVPGKPLGYFQVAAGGVNSAATLSSLIPGGIPTGTTKVVIAVSAQAIRYRDDGTAPTATVGFPIAAGATLTYDEAGLAAMQIISQVAGAALDILCYGRL